MSLYVRQSFHSLFQFPTRPLLLDTNCGSCVNDFINGQLRSRRSPFMCFISISYGCSCCNSHQKPFKEKNHLLIFVNIHLPIVIKHVKTNCNDNVQMLWFKHQKVLVLILEDKLTQERIFLLFFKISLQLFMICVATIGQNS